MTDNPGNPENREEAESGTVHRAVATAEGGHVRTEDGAVSSALGSPLNPSQGAPTPENLLAAGFAACLHHAAAEAAAGGDDEGDRPVRVRTTVGLDRDDDGRYALDVRATVFAEGMSEDQQEAIAREANGIWPFGGEHDPRFTVSVSPGENKPPG
ncbi:organic hydroperoxide reductase OsmC/OhrA [Spinactinospora alkalitolerans]|uniref:Organic hydroperoxide reductase OsmC/OhrA n=1 Tax=Spinactinospora alkalitolerans TaxID=687207 RepID=A0A852U1A1_9ACTN|nr:OsmC family protein [Spinactinospora alkalitolerans]NYE49315.1 organic hydroperoxide reductase OsmC/OhrA [Spinactinospora alkalitolerans]